MDLRAYSEAHGGLHPQELRKYGFKSDEILDFSVNSNPFGPSPQVLQALTKVDISTYPERDSHALRGKLADLNGVNESQVLVGNGTSELIWLVCRAQLQPDDEVVIIGPTFGEYMRASMASGARISEIRAEAPGFELPVDKAIEHIRKSCPKMAFLCNPNNPTGSFLNRDQLKPLIDACGKHTLLVIDEAYLPFVDGAFFVGLQAGNLLCLRSMTKEFAVAGLRLGYAIGKAEWIAAMRSFQPTWSVNGYAQAAGLQIIESLDYYRETLSGLKTLTAKFFQDLREAGYQPVPSTTHYCIFPTKIPARTFRQEFLKHGIQLRDCTSFGLSHYIRISTKLREQNSVLLSCLKKLKFE